MAQIEYRIKEMNVSEYAFLEDKYNVKEEVFGINNSLKFQYDTTNRVLICIHDITLSQLDKPFMMVQLISSYDIKQESVDQLISDDKIVFPTGFLVQCSSISYGTLRGVVLVKANEKGLKSIIIPPVFINEFVKEPFVANLENL